jgi:hypothetical protein
VAADESDRPKDPGRGKNDVGNRTMQLDAFVDEMVETTGEEVPKDAVLAEVLAEHASEPKGAGGGGGGLDAPIISASLAPPLVSRPPPLPPKRIPKWAYLVGVVLVVLAIVAGVYVGNLFKPTPVETGEAATTDAPEELAPDEPELVPIQLDTVVVGGGEESVDEGEGEDSESGEGSEAPAE